MKFLIFLLCVVTVLSINTKPVIGIFTIPSDLKKYDNTQYSYIAASYVKQLEGAGAMVVPVPWDADYEEIDALMSQINGILFTGGDSFIYVNQVSPGYQYNKLADTASYIVAQAIKLNKSGVVFPLFGTCQGFQLLNYIASQYYPVLSAVAGDLGVERLLDIVEDEAELYKSLDDSLKAYITTVNGPYYSHHWGVLPQTYETSPSLNRFFKITAYSQDAEGLKFVASVEARDYPIYATQYHSEKHAFEWLAKSDHEPSHILMAQHIAHQFVQKARENPHTMGTQDLLEKVIYNYNPVNVMGDPGSSFVQVYIFPNKPVSQDTPRLLGIRMITEMKNL